MFLLYSSLTRANPVTRTRTQLNPAKSPFLDKENAFTQFPDPNPT
jgi:hypothetical protein